MAEVVDHGFSIETSEDGSVTRLKMGGAGIGGGAFFGFGFAGLLIGALLALAAQNGLVFFLIFGGSILVSCLMDANRKQQYEFEVTSSAVRLPNGKEYKKSDISELFVKNSSGQNTQSANVESGTIIVGGSGVTGAAVAGAAVLGNASKQMGAAAGQAISDSLAQRGYSVAIRHGRKVITLANHLKQDDAMSLFNKTSELL